MPTLALVPALALLVASMPNCEPERPFLSAHYPFDSSLDDASDKGHHATGPVVEFAPGREGQAVKLNHQTLEVPNHADLQLAPGFTIDCWVYFDEKPTGYQPFVLKEKEYQLRLDDQREGGEFSFFVHLDGWEPRIRSVAPQPGRWYHLVASWSGTEISLEVNGRRFASPRIGTPKPGEEPVRIGKANCRIDELKLLNPNLVKTRQMKKMIETVATAGRTTERHFGGGDGWRGWRPEWGARMTEGGGVVSVQFPQEHAMLLNPSLDIDAGANTWVSIDLRSSVATHASLTFITDAGTGIATLPVWDLDRTCLVNLASHPAWRGKLKLLGLSFPDGTAHEAGIRNLWISAQPEGSPFLYVRNLAPGRAILRVGREEKIIALVRNLGTAASEVRATLTAPQGVHVLDEVEKRVAKLRHNGTQRFEWTVRAGQPVTGQVEVRATCGSPAEPDRSDRSAARFGGTLGATRLPLRFEPPCPLPKATYVPPPRPARSKTLNLMHYCPLWKAGTHYGWERIDPWPERKPALGWYDEGTPEVADWHIKYALEHGIQGFIYCWYRSDFSPEIHQMLGHAIHEGLMNARYLDQFKFTIMWENGCAKGVKGRADLMDNVFPYWMENYFVHPSYVKLDNKPVLFVWRPERVAPELGGSEATREALDAMREECRKRGFDGLYVVGCVSNVNEGLLHRLAEEGWDATSAYATWSSPEEEPGMDLEGLTTLSHRAHMDAQKDVWLGKKKLGALPDIVSIMQGWDPRPWHGPRTRSYQTGASADNFRRACLDARRILDATPGNGLDKRLVVFDNWDEFGEGHYIEPTAGFGFQFVDVIREVFCDETEPCRHVIPEDVGLEPPDRIYRLQREIMGLGTTKRRKVVDSLVAWWTFDETDDYVVRDSSQCGFSALKQDVKLTEGVRGKGMLCDGGTASLGADPLLFPQTGITIELWLKTDTPDQQDRWILNTISQPNSGYRLGVTGGKLCWQVPQTAWSHLVADPDPVPVGKWTHVAATYDSRALCLYVDGEEVASAKRYGVITPTDSRLCLGSYTQGDRQHNFTGAIDEVRIYDRALSAGEVAVRARAQAE